MHNAAPDKIRLAVNRGASRAGPACSTSRRGSTMATQPVPPGATFNFAAHLFDENRERGGRTAIHRRRGAPELRGARATVPPLRPRVDRRRPATRRTRAAADARHDRLADCLSRLAVCRRRPRCRQHAALRRRLRLHDRSLPRTGGAGFRTLVAGARRRAGEGHARRTQGDRLATEGFVADGSDRVRRLSWRRTRRIRRRQPVPTTSRSGCTRPGRPGGRRARCTRMPIRTGPSSCTASVCSAWPSPTSCFRRRSCSSPTASAMH